MKYKIKIESTYPKITEGIYKGAVATVLIDIVNICKIRGFLKEENEYYSMMWIKTNMGGDKAGDVIRITDHKLSEKITDAALESMFGNGETIEFSTDGFVNDINDSFAFSIIQEEEPIIFDISIYPMNNSELKFENIHLSYYYGEFHESNVYIGIAGNTSLPPFEFYDTYTNDIKTSMADYIMEQLVCKRQCSYAEVKHYE